tara:strand:- start:966 stop:1376 length:411 start_codon:yes stop_codon:yes gene_type:complete
MPKMKYSESLHNQILQHKIDLSSLDFRELVEWLKSSFILILSKENNFPNTISMTPLQDENYKILILIEAVADDKVFKIEYGEYINKDSLVKSLVKNNISRLSLLNFDSNDINLSKLNSLDYYTLIKTKKRKTLIIY